MTFHIFIHLIRHVWERIEVDGDSRNRSKVFGWTSEARKELGHSLIPNLESFQVGEAAEETQIQRSGRILQQFRSRRDRGLEGQSQALV